MNVRAMASGELLQCFYDTTLLLGRTQCHGEVEERNRLAKEADLMMQEIDRRIAWG